MTRTFGPDGAAPDLEATGHDCRNPQDILLDILLRIKSNGLQTAFHGGGWEDIDSHTYPSSQAKLHALCHSLSESKQCMAALQDIRRRLAKRIRLLHDRCIALALQHGMHRLPDEILAHIFEAGHAMTDTHQFSLNVSHVSHRFRTVAIRTPLLWTRLCFDPSDHLIRLFISRSVQMDLSVFIDANKTRDQLKFKRLFTVVSSHSERWSHLRIRGFVPPIIPLIVPRLQHLQCETIKTAQLEDLNMPSLLHFQGRSVEPTLSCRLQLTTCELNLHGTVSANSLCKAIYEMKNLQHLSITLDGCRTGPDYELFYDPWSDDEEEDIDKKYQFDQIELESLSFSIKDGTALRLIESMTLSMARWLLSKTTKLAVEDTTSGYSTKYLNPHGDGVLFPSSAMSIYVSKSVNHHKSWGSFDFLTSVVSDLAREAAMYASNYPYFTISIESPLTSFIAREELSQPLSNKPWTQYAFLRSLRLKNCDRLYEWQVQAFAEKLTSFPEGKGLQSLQIISCRNISEEFSLDLREAVGDKLRISWVL